MRLPILAARGSAWLRRGMRLDTRFILDEHGSSTMNCGGLPSKGQKRQAIGMPEARLAPGAHVDGPRRDGGQG